MEMKVTGQLNYDEFWDEIDRVFALVRDRARTEPIYGIANWPSTARLNTWDLGNGVSRSVDFIDGNRCLTVFTTTSKEEELDSTASLSVDGSPRPAVFFTSSEGSEAITTTQNLRISVSSNEALGPGLKLERIADVQAIISAQLQHLAELRGEERPR